MEMNPSPAGAVPIRARTVALSEPLPQESLAFKYSIVNTTNVTITVVHRNGIAYRVPPTRGTGNTPGIYITFNVLGTTQVIFDAFNEFNVSDELLEEDVKQLKHSYEKPHMRAYKTMSVNHRITLEELLANRGTIYDTRLDLIVSNSDDKSAIGNHPAATQSMVKDCLQLDNTIFKNGAFMFNIAIVDNKDEYGDRYINIAGDIYRIAAIRDPEKLCGVYLSMSAKTSGQPNDTGQLVPFSDFESHPLNKQLFKTASEARALGDVLEAKEREIKEKLIEQQRLTAEAKMQQIQLEAEREELRLQEERSKAKLEDERRMLEHQRAIQSLDRKDYYEQASYARKDSSEMWKILPAVFTGILAFATLFKGK